MITESRNDELNQTMAFSIFEMILKEGPISRVEIARRLNLSKASVSAHTSEMVSQGLCYEQEDSDYIKVGRRPVLLDVSPISGYLISIVLESTASYVVLSNLKREKLDSVAKELPFEELHDYQVTFYKNEITGILKNNNILPQQVKLLAVCTPGYYDNTTNQFCADGVFQNWQVSKLCEELGEHFEWQTYLVNDMNAAAWGEYCLSGSACKNMLYIGGGAGIGAALIIDGKLSAGWTGQAGEISHIPLYRDPQSGELVESGQLATFKAVLERIKREGPESTFAAANLQYEEKAKLSFKDVLNLIRVGEAFATECMLDMAEIVGRLICNFVLLLNCESVVIGGEFANFPALLLPTIKKYLDKYVMSVPQLKTSVLKNQASIYGLMVLAEEELSEIIFQEFTDREKKI